MAWPWKRKIDLADIQRGKVQITHGGKPVKMRSYAGAAVNRLNADWKASSADANQEIRGGLERLRNRSRALYRNNPYAKGAINQIVNNVVGRGLSLQFQSGPAMPDEIAKEIEAAWWIWNRQRYCDAAGRQSFTQIQRMLLHSMIESGEVFIHKVQGFDRGINIPLMLEVMESDHCPVDLEGYYTLPDGRRNRIVQGVEINGFNQPVAYWLRRTHPGNARGLQDKPERILAANIIHVFKPTRPGQLRGVPALHADMGRLKDLGAYEEAEIAASRMSSSKAMWLQDENGVFDAKTGSIDVDWESGAMGILPAGLKPVLFDPQHPTAQVEAFVSHILRGIAAGLDLSYEAVTRDYSKTTYSSARTAILAERDVYRSMQDWLGEHVLTRIFEWWGSAAVGVVTIPGWFDGVMARERIIETVRWQAQGWKEIDPLKETRAKVQKLDNNLSTLQDLHAEEGADWREKLRQRAIEKQYAKELEAEYGVSLASEQEAAAEEAEDSPANGSARTLEQWSFPQ